MENDFDDLDDIDEDDFDEIEEKAIEISIDEAMEVINSMTSNEKKTQKKYDHLHLQVNMKIIKEIGKLLDLKDLFERKKVTKISLSNAGVDIHNINLLFDLLEMAKDTIEYLNLNLNNLDDDGLHSLSDFILCSASSTSATSSIKMPLALKVLLLKGNAIGDNGCEFVAEYLSSPFCVLEELQLSRNKIADVGAGQIANSLQVNKTLHILDVSNNQISHDGAIKIFDALTFMNNTLKKLEFGSNSNIKPVANENDIDKTPLRQLFPCGPAMAKMLSLNKGLTHINFSSCLIGDVGAFFIANGLQYNSTLEYVNVTDDRMTKGCFEIISAVKHHKGLKYLLFQRLFASAATLNDLHLIIPFANLLKSGNSNLLYYAGPNSLMHENNISSFVNENLKCLVGKWSSLDDNDYKHQPSTYTEKTNSIIPLKSEKIIFNGMSSNISFPIYNKYRNTTFNSCASISVIESEWTEELYYFLTQNFPNVRSLYLSKIYFPSSSSGSSAQSNNNNRGNVAFE